MKLGDAVATFAQPIARGFDFVAGTDIANCGGCSRRQQFLNNISDSVFEFFSKPKQERSTMQFNVTIIVEASTVKEAVNKISDDIGEVAAVNPRPPQPQQPQVVRTVTQPAR
jgi:hypothetical protein